MARVEIERAIEEEEDILERIAGLLETRCDLASWPLELLAALGLALDGDRVPRAEGWKALALRRHIFGPTGTIPSGLVPPVSPSITDRRRAETLRAGLAARVRYRAGAYLLQASDEG